MFKVYLISVILMMSGYTDCNDNPVNSHEEVEPVYAVSGQVYDAATNQLIDSVKICLESYRHALCSSSSSNGGYSLLKENGRYKVTASHPRYHSYARYVTLNGASIRHNIHLTHR